MANSQQPDMPPPERLDLHQKRAGEIADRHSELIVEGAVDQKGAGD